MPSKMTFLLGAASSIPFLALSKDGQKSFDFSNIKYNDMSLEIADLTRY